jgi:Heparinase II/III-like protein
VCMEQATCYHKFSLQFLLACGLCGRRNGDDFSKAFWSRLESAMTFVASIMDCRGNVPPIGDGDDGDVWRLGHGSGFNSYLSLLALGAALFKRSDFQAKVESVTGTPDPQLHWLLHASVPVADRTGLRSLPTEFPSGGYMVLGDSLHDAQEFRVIMDCGPLGSNRVAGHGHADALSVLVSWEGDPVLVDSGTYCYNAAAEFRHFFRGTHAHNTLVVDDQDQSEYGASFLWLRDVICTIREARANAGSRVVHASHDGYTHLDDPVVHHRRVTLHAHDGSLLVEDWLDCALPHAVELLWHAAPDALFRRNGEAWDLRTEAHALRMSIDGGSLEQEVIEGRESPPQGWVSTRFYQRLPAPVLSVRARLSPLQVLRTVIRRQGR